MVSEIRIDLQQPAAERWQLSAPLQAQAKSLLQSYLHDLDHFIPADDREPMRDLLTDYARAFIEPGHFSEIEAVAQVVNCPLEQALLISLYYDLLKVVIGCTAFAIDTPDGPLHARNLDWWTENAMLSRYTTVSHFTGAANGASFKSVGWPGFVGLFSGLAPGRFAITLNAVSSNDPPVPAKPISLYLRTVFEQANSYEEAVDCLIHEEIASDCLLLVSGTRPGEMAVIERTPTRAALREPKDGFIAATNEYRSLEAPAERVASPLVDTSSTRFNRITELVAVQRPTEAATCLEVLNDPEVKLSITVQQMVMSAATGELEVRLP